MLIQDGGRVLGVRLPETERRYDIGSYERYFEAFAEFALADPRYGDELRAFVRERIDSAGDGDAGCS